MYRVTIRNGGAETVIHSPQDDGIRLSYGKFTEELNQIPSFDFGASPANPCFSEGLHDRSTEIEVLNTLTGEVEFEGVLLKSGKSMSSSGELRKTAVCEGYLGYLCDSVQMYHTYLNLPPVGFLSELLRNHNSQVTDAGHPEKYIYMGLCDVAITNTNSKTTAYRNTLEEIKVNLIERLGGEIRIRKTDGRLYLDYLTRIGSSSQTAVELAKNMESLEVQTDAGSIVTRLIPLGAQPDGGETAERLDISSVNGGIPYIDDEAALAEVGRIIVGTAVFDDITLPENLIKAGREYLQNNNRIKKSYRAQVLDLSVIYGNYEGFRAGNSYRFVNSFLGLDEELRLVKRTVDIVKKPYSPTVEIGDKSESLTDITVRANRLIEYEMPQQKSDILTAAKATATALIEAGINGYVVVNPNEILIMDTPDKETATRVWRWNSGGFGYSSTGYHGTYGTAITMEGEIVADFITAGVLRGMEINNGSGTFRVDKYGTVSASAMNITGGSIHITTNSETYDIVELSCREWTHKLSPLEWVLSNSSEGFSIKAQAGAMWFRYGDATTVWIGSRNGDISANGSIHADGSITTDGNMICDDLRYYAYGTRTSVSLADRMKFVIDSIADLQQRVAALEGNT